MVRLMFRVSGRLAMVGCVVVVALAAKASQSGHAAGALGLAELGIGLAGWWLASVVLITMADRAGRVRLPKGDPYEDHPKMSPSVQPSYVQYGRGSAVARRGAAVVAAPLTQPVGSVAAVVPSRWR